MTQDELDEIKARAEAATPGPWKFIEGDNIPSRIEAGDWRIDLIIGSAESWHSFNFIARARADVPALVAEVERLRAQNAELLEALESMVAWVEYLGLDEDHETEDPPIELAAARAAIASATAEEAG